jgi:hypothetical protein
MTRTFPSARRLALAAAALAVAAGGVVHASSGPSSSDGPYVLPTLAGVRTTAILTVGDSVNDKPDGTPYRMVGIPDGLGAFDNGDGTFTVLMNHELGSTAGVLRAHGAKGAFVSRWVVDKDSLEVLHGEDLVEEIGVWTGSAWDYSTTVAMNRLCSADLPEVSAFYDRRSRRGYAGRLFLNGEESGSEGQAFAHGMHGTSWRLPWLGRFSWENCVAHPDTDEKTVVVGIDDSGDGQVYVYVGEKKSTGNPVERAGLTGGTLYGIRVDGFPFEVAATGIPSGTSFDAYSLGDVSGTTGATLQTVSRANLVTEFQRPEDGAWDPKRPKDFYFVTTASFTGNSRLWRLRFEDPARPWLGGRIDMLLDGSEGQRMLDNMTVDRKGRVYLQEDPGGQAHLAKIWRYDVKRDALVEIAHHDPARFLLGAPGFLTVDEESSGIIDVSDILGRGTFLIDVQAHYALSDPELVQGGQLLLLETQRGRGHGHGHGHDHDDDDDDEDDDCDDD